MFSSDNISWVDINTQLDAAKHEMKTVSSGNSKGLDISLKSIVGLHSSSEKSQLSSLSVNTPASLTAPLAKQITFIPHSIFPLNTPNIQLTSNYNPICGMTLPSYNCSVEPSMPTIFPDCDITPQFPSDMPRECVEQLQRIYRSKQFLLHDVETVQYRPQSFSNFSAFYALQTHLRNQLSDVAISKIEGLMALYLALSDVQSPTGFAAVLTLYAKTHNQLALTTQLKDITVSLFNTYNPQSTSKRPLWLDQMVDGLTNWKLLVNSPSFTQISRVLSLLVTLGVIDNSSITLGNFELFAVQAQAKHVNAFDLVDALAETVVYFAEGAYQCFLTGSLKPLLFSSSEIIQIEERCIEKETEFEFVQNGNLAKFSEKSEAQFDKELADLIDDLHVLVKTMPSGAEKKIVTLKWEKFSRMMAAFTQLRVCGGLRKSPYCLKIFGGTGVGKSTFADLTMSAVLKACGVPCTSDYIVTLNEKEKFMSTYKSFITGVKIDDYGNTKAEFWECAPSDWIIKLCNNIREAAIMADVASKGKISIEPSCVTITTNVEHLHAGKTSNNPMSILRRAHIHVELKVRPEFMTDRRLDTSKVLKRFGNLGKIHDVWYITLKKPVCDGENEDQFNHWEIIKENINIFEYLNIVLTLSRQHYAEQGIITDSFAEPSELIVLCPLCNLMSETCTCEACEEEPKDLGPQYGERIAHTLATKAKSVHMDFNKIKCSTETRVEDLAVDTLVKGFKWFDESPYAKWTSWVPESWMDNNYVRSIILWNGEDIIGQSVKRYWYNMLAASFVTTGIATKLTTKLFVPTLLFCAVNTIIAGAGVVEAKKNAYLSNIVEERQVLQEVFVSARDKHIKYACGAFAGLTVLYSAVKIVRALRGALSVQGSLQPKSIADIKQRDTEVNPWKSVPPMEREREQKCYQSDSQATNALRKMTGQIICGTKCSGAFALRSNVIIIPFHFVPKEATECTFHYSTRQIRFILTPERVQRIGDLDLALVYVPNTGPLLNVSSVFRDNYTYAPNLCTMYGLTNSRQHFTSRVMWKTVHSVSNSFAVFNGSYYEMSDMNTFDGQCMSPVCAEGCDREILGFHIGGKQGTPRGCGIAVLRAELETAVYQLGKLSETHILGPQAQEIEDVVAQKKIALNPGVHPKCPSNFIEDSAAVEVYGSVTGRNTYTSNVIPTPISDIVKEVTGVPNTWGPPQFTKSEVSHGGRKYKSHWRPWYASLKVCSQPSIGFNTLEVENAMMDYLAELKECHTSQKSLWKSDIRVLTDIEIVSGIDGLRFIDSMSAGTSMGYPIGGAKRNFLVDLVPTMTHACPRTFTDEIWELVRDLEEKADNNLCLNQIFGAAMKDEPTPVSKEKVRIFQAAPIALQIIIRKYFLPVGRFLSSNPLVAECAVGINSHGPEWHELCEFMAFHGEDRVIAGDYSKYDLRMPAQLTLTAFNVMIKIASWSGNYSARDIDRMRVIAHEVCTPLVAYNGTLMRFMGTNPSGQNMTVYLNSIVNSLLHRLAFNNAYDEVARKQIGQELKLGRPARFRDLVTLSTYGDDAKGSVRRGYDAFNHVSMAEYLAKNDMIFTMPDKHSNPVPFMSRFTADFLKRKDRFDEDLGVYVGALDEASIFKSLHSILESKAVSSAQVSLGNIEGAMREWFYHGRTVYDKRLVQMKEVARRANLPSPDIDVTFDERVQKWKGQHDYTPQSGSVETVELITVEMMRLTETGRHFPPQALNHLKGQINRYIKLAGDCQIGLQEAALAIRKIEPKLLVHELHNAIFGEESDSSGFISENCSDISSMTEQTGLRTIARPVNDEQVLIDRTIALLGEPLECNTIICNSSIGEIDLLYLQDGVALIIECKRVVGRLSKYKKEVTNQAIKYSTVVSILRPDLTVYGITCTEYGYTIVECFGEPLFPDFCAELLDSAPVAC